jgi:molybdate transport system substrate-binding protein
MTGSPADVERITGISSMAMRHVLTELCVAYEQQSGQPVAIDAVGGVDAARRVGDGEAFDFVVLAAEVIDRLSAGGRVVPGSRTDLACSEIAMAVAAGTTRPDVANAAAVRSAVLNARTIGYSTGPSGDYLIRLFEQWGIADAVARRLVQASPGLPVATLVACGDVELGFQQLSELLHVPGIDVVGVLPPEIRHPTIFSAGICTASNHRAAARTLLDFLASTRTGATKRRHGMAPA